MESFGPEQWPCSRQSYTLQLVGLYDVEAPKLLLNIQSQIQQALAIQGFSSLFNSLYIHSLSSLGLDLI